MERYAITIDMYIHAKSFDEAIDKADDIKNEIDFKHDNSPRVITIEEAPYGVIKTGSKK